MEFDNDVGMVDYLVDSGNNTYGPDDQTVTRTTTATATTQDNTNTNTNTHTRSPYHNHNNTNLDFLVNPQLLDIDDNDDEMKIDGTNRVSSFGDNDDADNNNDKNIRQAGKVVFVTTIDYGGDTSPRLQAQLSPYETLGTNTLESPSIPSDHQRTCDSDDETDGGVSVGVGVGVGVGNNIDLSGFPRKNNDYKNEKEKEKEKEMETENLHEAKTDANNRAKIMKRKKGLVSVKSSTNVNVNINDASDGISDIEINDGNDDDDVNKEYLHNNHVDNDLVHEISLDDLSWLLLKQDFVNNKENQEIIIKQLTKNTFAFLLLVSKLYRKTNAELMSLLVYSFQRLTNTKEFTRFTENE